MPRPPSRCCTRKKIAATPEEDREAVIEDLTEEHQRVAGGVDRAMSIGVVDEIIDPKTTRTRIAEALSTAPDHRGTHNNIPL
ncbi:hypothetical protein GCM10009854_28990 [Saccharopolyspora halophila]|uniref:Acetyl-CoA carboxylase domain-containing protein n=1 Tax=Saccharopolyspora halophila TaxID=405551 RepID=A0ABP5TCC8_9PSEU